MPPAKKATRKTTKKTARKAVKRAVQRPGPRTLSATHKRALADGRTMSATVDRYLAAVNAPQRRGRKVSKASLEQRLVSARQQLKAGTGVAKVLAAKEVRDLQARIAQLNSTTAVDLKSLDAAFVKIAKQFSDNRGIGYGAWRDAGVPADVLKRAGIARTRG